jgi:uroporphyrinogen decarboxylase
MYGGMDKRVPAKGKTAIDQELDSKIPFMLRQGGYIPYLDHLIPPDIPWDNFVYYRNRLNKLIQRKNIV